MIGDSMVKFVKSENQMKTTPQISKQTLALPRISHIISSQLSDENQILYYSTLVQTILQTV